MATWTSQRTGRWNDDAANASSPWNGGANPATGVPANTDTVVIAISHDVEYDADMTAFAVGVTLTITGTLHASTTAGAYVLKLQANMTGAGTLRAGTSGTPYPVTCTFEIVRRGFEITATSMVLDLNCAEPTTKYVRISGAAEAAGQTVLSVDTNVTAEVDYWKDGATVRVDDSNKGVESEERVIAVGGVAATTITITSGLTAQKEVGSFIILISRNVKITHTSNSGIAVNSASSGVIKAEIQGASIGASDCNSCTIGGTISDVTTGISGGNGNTVSTSISGASSGISTGSGYTVSGLISGCTNGINTGAGFLLASTCIISGCTTGINGGAGHILLGCTITGCTSGINAGSGYQLISAILSNNTQDINRVPFFGSYNTTFASSTEFTNYANAARGITAFAESIEHDATANAYRAWSRGGIVSSDTGVVFGTRPRSFKHTPETASFYVFRNYNVTVEAGGGLVVQCYIRKDASMAYLPRVWILTPGQEPFISGSPNAEAIMTDSVDTWETLVLVYANAGSSPVSVTVRTLAKNATGNVYFDPIITVLAPATYDVYNTLLGYVDTLETRLTATRAGYLDNLSAGAVALQTSVDDLEGRLTATRAGYLDNLSAGPVATQASVDTIDNFLDTEIADILARLPAALIGGRMDSNVQAMATDVITAAVLAASAITEIQTGLAVPGSAMTLTAGERDSIAAAFLDLADAIETGLTPRQAMRLFASALAGVLSGAATNTVTIRNAVANSKARITATVDSDGNRSVVNTDTT